MDMRRSNLIAMQVLVGEKGEHSLYMSCRIVQVPLFRVSGHVLVGMS